MEFLSMQTNWSVLQISKYKDHKVQFYELHCHIWKIALVQCFTNFDNVCEMHCKSDQLSPHSKG